MNAIAKVFIDVYEKDRDVMPKELIEAGWTYKDLAAYMHCCEVIRSIGVAWGPLWMKGGQDTEIIRTYFNSRLEKISEKLSRLIDEEIHFDLRLASFLNSSHAGFSGGFFHLRGPGDSIAYSSECFSTLLRDDEDAILAISYFIGKYIVTGVTVELVKTEDLEKMSVATASARRDNLQRQIFELERNEPNFAPEVTLATFPTIQAYGKQLGEYQQKHEDLEDKIQELDDYLKDPKAYIRKCRMKKLHNLGIKVDLDKISYDRVQDDDRSWLSVELESEIETHTVEIVDDTARILRPFRALPVRLGGDDGQPVLQTDQITDFLKCKTGQPEIFKLSAAVD